MKYSGRTYAESHGVPLVIEYVTTDTPEYDVDEIKVFVADEKSEIECYELLSEDVLDICYEAIDMDICSQISEDRR
jgi:hypothetical protein